MEPADDALGVEQHDAAVAVACSGPALDLSGAVSVDGDDRTPVFARDAAAHAFVDAAREHAGEHARDGRDFDDAHRSLGLNEPQDPAVDVELRLHQVADQQDGGLAAQVPGDRKLVALQRGPGDLREGLTRHVAPRRRRGAALSDERHEGCDEDEGDERFLHVDSLGASGFVDETPAVAGNPRIWALKPPRAAAARSRDRRGRRGTPARPRPGARPVHGKPRRALRAHAPRPGRRPRRRRSGTLDTCRRRTRDDR